MACKKYTIQDCRYYIGNEFNSDERKKFESHCHDCPSCLKNLYMENEQIENERLLSKTMAVIDQAESSVKTRFFDIVLKISNGIIDVIKADGYVISPMIPVAVRGENTEHPKEIEPVKVIHELDSFSIQFTAQTNSETGQQIMRVSVYNSEVDEFIPGAIVDLSGETSGETFSFQKETDESGEAEFVLFDKGLYRLKNKIDGIELVSVPK